MMGFPVNYTAACLPKSQRSGAAYNDCRLTLIGNTWCVPVVACLLEHLFSSLGIIAPVSPQAILDRCHLENIDMVQGRLFRLPLNTPRAPGTDKSQLLARQLGCLISVKGEDLMLTTPTSQLPRFQKLRTTVPGKLWRWRIVAGWQWRSRAEHINSLELRAIFTAVRWRIEHKGQCRTRFIHLTDSLVCLHCWSRGRSSSRKLRRTVARLNALTLASGCQPVWGYINTHENPADKPST